MPMQPLSEMLLAMGCQNVKTYIQSGNVLLEHQQADRQLLSELIATQMEHNFGFTPKMCLLTLNELQQAIANNPFKAAQSAPKSLHVFFLSEPVVDDKSEQLKLLKEPSESFQLLGQTFYLHAPEGTGRSKLAAKVEKILAVPVTARNWNTVTKLTALADI